MYGFWKIRPKPFPRNTSQYTRNGKYIRNNEKKNVFHASNSNRAVGNLMFMEIYFNLIGLDLMYM